MKTAVLLIFTIITQIIYGTESSGFADSDDYLGRLKVAIGTKDPAELAYLDLRIMPSNDSKLLPFKKEYIFLDGAVVVECTVETLLFECIIGHKGLAERSSFRVTNIADAFAKQKLSVRCIKLRMAHWVANEQHRFVNKYGLPSQLRRDRDLAKVSNVFGLYQREEFLESCRPLSVGMASAAVDYLAALLVLDALLKPLPPQVGVDRGGDVPKDTPTDEKEDPKKAKQRAKKAADRRKCRLRKAALKASRATEAAKDGFADDDSAPGLVANLDTADTTDDDDLDVIPAIPPTEAVRLPQVLHLTTDGCLAGTPPSLRDRTPTKRAMPHSPSISPTRSSIPLVN